jgi:hypothetical protein
MPNGQYVKRETARAYTHVVCEFVKDTHSFGGGYWHVHLWTQKKERGEKELKRLRKQGFKAEIVPVEG